MPTLDQLAPVTAASDSDVLLVSQSGIARKATRSQVLAGVQPQLAVSAGTLLGRQSAGTGGPEQITVGANLSLANGRLSATGTPFVVASLPSGTVPTSNDIVPIGQSGTNSAVTYGQFMSGLAEVANIDATKLLVTPTGRTSPTRLGDLAASTLPLSGGTLTGALTLSADPSTPLQAATKEYVDTQVTIALPKTGGALSGALTLSADPVAPLQAATRQYVDGQVAAAVPRTGGALTGPLTLAADPSGSMQAATKQYVDTRVSRGGDTLTGALLLATDPSAPLQAATKGYVDSQVAGALPRTGGTLTGGLMLAADPTGSLQSATKQYVDTRVLRNGDTLTGALVLAADPAAPMQAATKGYVDGLIAGTLPKSGGTLTGGLTLAADPAGLLQAATKQYVDTRAYRNGDTFTGALFLASDPALPLQAATKAYVDGQVAGSLSKSGGALTGALTLAADPTSSLQASTRHYVDMQVASSLPLSGGSLTGALGLPSNPIAPLQAATKQYVDGQVTVSVPLSGGTMTGALNLAADPAVPLQAATKRYVDSVSSGMTGVINVRSAPYNAVINGVADDTAAFKAAYQAAPAGSVIYVPNGVTVMQNPYAWGIPLTKRVKWIVDGTSLTDGTSLADVIPGGGSPANNFLPGFVTGNSAQSAEFSQSGSQPTDFAIVHSSYIVNHAGGPTGGAVSANTRNDTIIYNSPNNFIWGGLDRLLWCGTQTPTDAYNAGFTAEHVGRYVQTIRQNAGTDPSGKPLPQPHLWSACLEYRDTTGLPSSRTAASLTVEMDWYGNGPDDASLRHIQALIIGQHDIAGTPVEVGTVIGVYLAAKSTGHVNRVLSVNVPFSTAVVDTTAAQEMTGAATIRMAAGQGIAFEPTNSCRLDYDSTTNTLRWHQGTLSYAVGKGITVGWTSVYSSNTVLPNYLSGNIIFLSGSGSPYTITLPAASTVAAGTGFTFSVLGSAAATIASAGSDAIDNGPITLRQHDRYHIVSDGSSAWHEVFRANSVSPRFSAPPVMPSYVVASLPAAPGAGATALASNGRKPGEVAGGGSGVGVFYDGSRWISVCSGSQVLA